MTRASEVEIILSVVSYVMATTVAELTFKEALQ